MKKYSKWVIAVLAICLLFSLRSNVGNAAARKQSESLCINNIYGFLTAISTNLDGFLMTYEKDTDVNNHHTLENLALDFMKLDTAIYYSRQYLDPSIAYPGVLNFGYIAATLGHGSGTLNSVPYQCILYDEVISHKEIAYLEWLKADIDTVLALMVSPDNPPQESDKLNVYIVNNILKEFYATWSRFYEDSPYMLLVVE